MDRTDADAYSDVATTGLKLYGAYKLAPLLLGGLKPGLLAGAVVASGSLMAIPIVPTATVVCCIPLAWHLTKRIPRKVRVPAFTPDSWTVRVGKTYRGRWVKFTFNGQVPHIVVAGSTGYGKTKFLEYLLYMLCHQQSSNNLQIIIVDLKDGASFSHWIHVPHVLAVVDGLKSAETMLAEAESVMKARLGIIKNCRVGFKPVPNFSRLLVVVDEGSILKLSDTAMEILQRLVIIGREPHVHVLYATQRPSNEVLPLQIRDQLEGRFAFHVNEPGSSKVVLGENNIAAYELPRIKGRMIHQTPSGDVQLQTPYISDEVITAWLMECADVNKEEQSTVDDAERREGTVATLSVVDFADRFDD